MPTRLDGSRIYRSFEIGSLARLIMVDRQRRFLWPAAGDGDTYLDLEQMAWLDGQLRTNASPWTMLCTQTLFASWKPDLVPFGGSWNLRDQRRVIDGVRAGGSDLIALSGDVHRFEATEVVVDATTYQPGSGTGSGGVEFTSGSVTSPGLDRQPLGSHVRWFDWQSRGYGLATVEPNQVQYDFWGFPNDAIRSAVLPQEHWLNGFIVRKGTPALIQATEGVS